MLTRRIRNLGGGLLLWAFVVSATAQAANKPPVIHHSPVKIAVRGQPVFIRATVTDDSGKIKSVTLYYAPSRDAAPFPISMQDAGSGSYSCSLSEGLLSGVDQITYYIEAVDALGATAETPWYTMQIKGLQQTEPGALTVVGGGGAPAKPAPERAGWVKPLLIGGAVAVVAGGVALSQDSGGGGGGGSSGGGGTTPQPGTFVGSATTCFQWTGSNTTCSTTPATFTVGSDGVVSSDNLREGESLKAKLSGANFVMVADVAQPDRNGQIQYVGSVLSDRIVGNIQGSATATTTNLTGVYSGSFTALRQ